MSTGSTKRARAAKSTRSSTTARGRNPVLPPGAADIADTVERDGARVLADGQRKRLELLLTAAGGDPADDDGAARSILRGLQGEIELLGRALLSGEPGAAWQPDARDIGRTVYAFSRRLNAAITLLGEDR